MLRQSDSLRALRAGMMFVLIATVAACGIKGPLRPAPKSVPATATPPPIANPATPPAMTSPAQAPSSAAPPERKP
jgi:predicted small lipoprotein YifL